jgi:hypothetical protein
MRDFRKGIKVDPFRVLHVSFKELEARLPD